MTDFQWPWQYSFPPFFTLQVNADVCKTQLDAWCQLVTAWGKEKGVTQVDMTEASNLAVFKNPAIERSLSPDSIQVVLEELARRGNLEWVDKGKRRGYLLWRSSSEWGQLLYRWAQTNSRLNTVCTLYELTHGHDTEGEEFHQLDPDILMKALRCLETAGKAEVMDFGENQGVKFL